MPQPNDYSFDLKHRLVGAAVLIVAAVIVLPFILPGQKQDHRHALIGNGGASVPIQQTFISRIEVDNPDVFAQQNSAESVSDESEPGKESDTQESAKDVKDQGVDDNRPVTDSIGLPSGWVVRVGVFQIAENAKKRQSLLDENGFNVNLEETKLDGKTAIRVFLGPFSTEDIPVLSSINLDQIVWVDAVVIAALVLSFGLGIFRGIVREILSLSSWIVSIWLAYLFGDNLAIVIVPWLESERLSSLIGYLVVFVAVLVLLSLVVALLFKLFRVVGLSGIDRLLGGLFGCLRGVVIVALLLFIAEWTPASGQAWFRDSQIVPYFEAPLTWFKTKVVNQLDIDSLQ